MNTDFAKQISGRTAYMVLTEWIDRMFMASESLLSKGDIFSCMALQKARDKLIIERDSLDMDQSAMPAVFYFMDRKHSDFESEIDSYKSLYISQGGQSC